MKRKLFSAIMLLLSSGSLMAQRVISTPDYRVIIDCRDMPAGSITDQAKERKTDGLNSRLGSDNLTSISSKTSNKKVSHYFEVSKSDTYDNVIWLNGILACQNKVDSDRHGLWRIPTQRELMLIWILHEPLKRATAGFTPLHTADYLSATEIVRSTAYSISFITGQVRRISKIENVRVRCIRDLTPP